MLSTFYVPLHKHYRIQSSSLLALNNPKSIYPACSNNRGTAPAWPSGLPKQASCLVPRMADHRQDLAERGCSKPCPGQGTASAAPCLPSHRSPRAQYCGTAKSPCKGPPQPLPHSIQRFIPTFTLQLLVQHVRVTCTHR